MCESESDKIIIFYSKTDGVVSGPRQLLVGLHFIYLRPFLSSSLTQLYMYAGDNLREKLPRDVIRRTAVEAKAAFSAGIYEGMKYLLKRIQ